MSRLFKNIAFLVSRNRAISLGLASVLGVSAVGGGAYAAYNKFFKEPGEEPELETVEVEQQAAASAADVYIPEFKKVFLTSSSIEKDLTIYISDTEEGENCVTGVPFQVKLVSPDAMETLQPYVSAIQDIDNQISEYTASYEDSVDISTILEERNVPVTVTDENNEVVETVNGDIESDPLYLLYLDKETAVQAYTVALNEAEGVVYTDEDMDGVINETEVEPGDYVACIVNSLDNGVSYNTDNYETEVNVKDKVEYKVEKEIIKQVKKDDAKEDGQPVEAAPVEATLTNTVEYVDSKKEETGGAYKETTDVVAPKSDVSKSKATKKDGKTSVTHDVVVAPSQYTITINYKLLDANGKEVTTVKKTDLTVNANAAPSFTADQTYGYNNVTYKLQSGPNPAFAAATANATYTYTYKAEPEAPKTYSVSITCVDENGKTIHTATINDVKDGDSINPPSVENYTCSDSAVKASANNKNVTFHYKKKQQEQKPEQPQQQEQQQDNNQNNNNQDNNNNNDNSNNNNSQDNQQQEQKPEQNNNQEQTDNNAGDGQTDNGVSETTTEARRTIARNNVNRTRAQSNTKKETATLDMSYSKGVFTISASGNVSSVTVNGAAITLSNGKGTYTATANGDYKLAGVATFSDGVTDNSLAVTYTVSGMAGGSNEKLKDSKGNQLYLDAEGKKEATAADYQKGKTYYYKEASYKYYGWQTIDGKTKFFNANGDYVTGEQVIQGVKYNFGSDGALVVNGVGIDVSKHQGTIDWKQAGPAVSFAIIRCGYRGMYDGQLHEDPFFYKNMSGAKANGENTGIYIYSTALNEAEAVAEASMAVAMAKKAGGCSLPIYIDMEDSVRGQKNLTNDQRNAIINAFCNTVQSAGYKSGVYANKTWMTKYINASSLPGSCHIWVAQYNTTCSYSGRYSMWQYSSKGSIPGIKGNVDVNKSFF